MIFRSLITCIFAFGSHLALGAEPIAPPPQQTIVFEHVTVIDVVSGSELADRSLVVAGGRFTAMGRAGEVAVPPAPGSSTPPGNSRSLACGTCTCTSCSSPTARFFVANGVTGVRVMWGNPPSDETSPLPMPHTQWRKEFSDGKTLGPRMVIASGMVDGPNPIWPGSVVVRNAGRGSRRRQGRQEGRCRFRESLRVDPHRCLLRDRRGVQGPWHSVRRACPATVTAAQASDAGQKSMEHLYGIRESCSTRLDELMKNRRASLQGCQGARDVTGRCKEPARRDPEHLQ